MDTRNGRIYTDAELPGKLRDAHKQFVKPMKTPPAVVNALDSEPTKHQDEMLLNHARRKFCKLTFGPYRRAMKRKRDFRYQVYEALVTGKKNFPDHVMEEVRRIDEILKKKVKK